MGKKSKNKNQEKHIELQKKESQNTQEGNLSSKEQLAKGHKQKQQIPPHAENQAKSKQQIQSKSNKNAHPQQDHRHHNKPHTHHQSKGNQEAFPHFTWEDVGKHDHKDDLWVVVEGAVYNLTKFVDKHPGGPKVIALRAGRKADEAFIAGNHPPRVMDKSLPHYRIGSVKQDSMIESWQREHKTGRMDLFMAVVLTLLILGFMGFMGYMIV